MHQLPLDIRIADHARFANFYNGGNDELVSALQVAAGGGHFACIWLWGSPGTGKSHLLQAAAAAAVEAGRTAGYLPLAMAREYGESMLHGYGELDVVCLDDASAVAGAPAWDAALFSLYESVRRRAGALLIAADRPARETRFSLPDLASRAGAAASFRLLPLDDVGRIAALTLRARFRGFDLPDETARYLLTRYDRSTTRLFRLLDELDQAALAAQKRLTIPFVRSIAGE